MEEYINASKGFLSLLQSTLDEQEMENSTVAANDMYAALQPIAEKHQLNIREMLNAILAVNVTVLEISQEQIQALKEKE